jgi:hypothetical protein
MTWAWSQGLVWQWQDDAGGWVNMHEDWMPQLTNLKKSAGGTIVLRHDWKQRNGGTRITWYTVDVNAVIQTSHDNGKTRRVRALAQVLPWLGDATASSQAPQDFTEHAAAGWPRSASGALSSGALPGTSSQSQTLPRPPPPPPAPPPPPHRDAWQQTGHVMDATEWERTRSWNRALTARDAASAWSQAQQTGTQPAPADTWQSALQPTRQMAHDEESIVIV